MEKKFLQYLLYITLIEIREFAHETGNSRIFYLTDLLHNTPFALDSEEGIKDAFKNLVDNINELKIQEWFAIRKAEFFSRFPEYSINDRS